MTGWMGRLGLAVCLALSLTLGPAGIARAGCDGDYYTGPLGVCLPKVGGTVGQIGRETQGQVLGHALEVWINASYSSAMNGARPMPAAMRLQLTGYIAESVMDRASYKVGDSGFLNAAFAAQHYGDKFGGDVLATTLVNVIVFRDEAAAADPALWAHELTHVKQFRDGGTHSFAINYARSSDTEENEAYAVGDGYRAWRRSHARGAPPILDPPPPSAPTLINGPAPGSLSIGGGGIAGGGLGLAPMSVYCVINPVRWCPLRAPALRGTPCACSGPNGLVSGVVQ